MAGRMKKTLSQARKLVFASRAEAEAACRELKQEAPPVPGAYRAPPVPPGKKGTLSLGILLGAIAGATAAAAVAFVGVFVVFLALAWASTGYGVVFMYLIISTVSLLFLPGTYIVAGLAASAVVLRVSRVPKELKGVTGWCLASAGLGALLARPALVIAASPFSGSEVSEFWVARALAALLGLGVAGWIYAAVGLLVSLFAAGMYLDSDKRYCGACQKYFKRKEFRRLPVRQAKEVAEALARGDFSSLSRLLTPEEFGRVLPILFRCPNCGRSYLDLKVDIMYRDEAEKFQGQILALRLDSWLVGSAELPQGVADPLMSEAKGA